MAVWNEYSIAEVAKHRTQDDCWVIVGADGAKRVYDLTAFLEDHPGGPELLLDLAGQDVQDEFEDIGHSRDARAMLQELCIGVVKEEQGARDRREAHRLQRLSLLAHKDVPESPQTSSRPSLALLFTSSAIALMVVVLAVVLVHTGTFKLPEHVHHWVLQYGNIFSP